MIDKPEVRDVTGYAQRKYYNYDPSMRHGTEMNDVSGVPILRASEAYLNYIEASYELNRTLDADARKYWDQLRQRAGITGTIDATINATDMSVEANVNRASYDWGAFSQGRPLILRSIASVVSAAVNSLVKVCVTMTLFAGALWTKSRTM